jgi:teichuronic acid biosynthesis glycosyltransferase TuaC
MIFARRESASLGTLGFEIRDFHLAERTAPRKWCREMRRLRAEIRDFDPDLIHAHYGTVTALTCALAKGRKPLVITFRGSDLNLSGAVSWLRSGMGRVLSQVSSLRAAAVICVSDGLRQTLWWRRKSANVIPTGVNLAVFRVRDRHEARRELGLDATRPVVMFNCGRDPWAKRIELAEATLVDVRRDLPEVEFVVMRGDWDPLRVPVLMAAADCLLVTSRREGSPNIVKEALACGLPVVSVDVGDVAEVIRGVENCHLCADSAEELAAAVGCVLRSGARSDGERHIAEFSTEKIAGRIANVYRSVLGLPIAGTGNRIS